MANNARRWVAAAVLSVALLSGAPGALAAPDDYVGRTPPTVPTDPVEPKVLGQVETRAATQTGTGATDPIPITGGDVVGLTVLGVAAIAAGTALLRRGRRAPG